MVAANNIFSDLLQSHFSVHGDSESHQAFDAPTYRIPELAGRAPVACGNCAEAKTQCDKQFPCGRCARRKLKCVLTPKRTAQKVGSPTLKTHPFHEY
jgi:hypothetical protein